jgi:dienelactone hydrolase
MTSLLRRAAATLAHCVLAGLVVVVAGRATALEVRAEPVRIAVDVPGASSMLVGVFLPTGDGPFPVLLYSHGRSGTPAERTHTRIPDVRSHVRYWLAKGFAVVTPIRPGYGETGGPDREDAGVVLDMFGNCWGSPTYDHAAAAAASAVLVALEWVRAQPWADRDRIVLAGASLGGLASIATAAKKPPGVVAYINFSGGTGGDGTRAPEHSCGSDAMESLMRKLGRANRVPGLWLYAKNDRFWGSQWPVAWYSAFSESAHVTQFVMTDPVPNSDGHHLLARGGRLWTAPVDSFLAEHGL